MKPTHYSFITALAALCCSACGTTSTHWEAGKFTIKNTEFNNFVITNKKHPSENFAVIVRPHEAKLNVKYDF